jgi:hypothetical protein
MNKIDLLLMMGGLVVALSISAIGVLGLVVWLAGGPPAPPREASLRAWPRMIDR